MHVAWWKYYKEWCWYKRYKYKEWQELRDLKVFVVVLGKKLKEMDCWFVLRISKKFRGAGSIEAGRNRLGPLWLARFGWIMLCPIHPFSSRPMSFEVKYTAFKCYCTGFKTSLCFLVSSPVSISTVSSAHLSRKVQPDTTHHKIVRTKASTQCSIRGSPVILQALRVSGSFLMSILVWKPGFEIM